MTTIDLAEITPTNPEHHTQPVAPLPARLGMHRVDLNQDDQGRPMTTVTLQEDRYDGAHVYVWTEDGEYRSSADQNDGVEGLTKADVEALQEFATAVHRNYNQLLHAALWNLIGNGAFIGEVERLAQR